MGYLLGPQGQSVPNGVFIRPQGVGQSVPNGVFIRPPGQSVPNGVFIRPPGPPGANPSRMGYLLGPRGEGQSVPNGVFISPQPPGSMPSSSIHPLSYRMLTVCTLAEQAGWEKKVGWVVNRGEETSERDERGTRHGGGSLVLGGPSGARLPEGVCADCRSGAE